MRVRTLLFARVAVLHLVLASMPAAAQQIAFERLELYGGAASAVRLGPDVLITGGGRYSLYRTTDRGGSWQSLHMDSFGGGVVSSVAATDIGGLALAAGQKGLFRSTDLGATWSLDSGVFAGVNVRDVSMSPSGRLLTVRTDSVATGLLWRSLDSGRTWRRVFEDREGGPVSYAVLDDTTLIAATQYLADTVIRTTIWLSTDAGMAWSATLDTIYRQGGPKLLGNGQAAVIQHGFGLMVSSDGGRTWNLTARPSTSWIEHLYQDGRTVFASLVDGSLHRSDDVGQTWRVLSVGFEKEPVAVYARVGDTLIGSTATEAVRSLDSGRTWTPISRGLLRQRFGPITSGQIGEIHTSAGSVLYSSTNAGSTWTRAGRPALPGLGTIQVIQPLADGALMVAGINGLFFSSHSRTVWTNRMTGLDGSEFERDIVSADLGANGDLVIGSRSGVFRLRVQDSVWIAAGLQGFAIPSVAIGRDGALFASALDPGVKGVYRMDQATFEWNRFEDGLAGVDAADMAVGSDSAVYLASMSGLYRTRPAGTRWERIDARLPVSDFRSIAVHRSGAVAASTRSSLIVSQDGTSWTVIDSNLPARIQSIAFDAEGRLLIATEQNGVHRSRDRVAVVQGEAVSMGHRLAVSASPNPASATLSFEVHSKPHRRYHLELFDSRGVLRFESTTESGARRMDIDVSGLSPGRYTYRLSSESESATGAIAVTR